MCSTPANFNPRPPRGGRLCSMTCVRSTSTISIHAPREGGDSPQNHVPVAANRFQSTPPARGATPVRLDELQVVDISIHAPREGGDRPPSRGRPAAPPISIHAPREGGDCTISPSSQVISSFQSTPPARGATAPRWIPHSTTRYFNPRPPRGGRQQRCTVLPADL